MLTQKINIKSEFQEGMQLQRILRVHQLFKIFNSQLFKSEKWQIAKYIIQDLIISIGAHWIPLVKDFDEQLQEFSISDTAIEYLLDEHFFIWVFDRGQEDVGVRIDGVHDVVECSKAFTAAVY